jgi:catechol 2,3-dioxygenase-like lactoylglutathione lyase family enzyme
MMRLNQVTVGCTDYMASAAFYRALGLTQIVDSPPRYARFETPTGETFSIHAAEVFPAPPTIVYFECDDLDGTVTRLAASGLTFDTMPQDQSWLWREARLRDPAGNKICLFHAGDARRFPPWRIASPDDGQDESGPMDASVKDN